MHGACHPTNRAGGLGYKTKRLAYRARVGCTKTLVGWLFLECA